MAPTPQTARVSPQQGDQIMRDATPQPIHLTDYAEPHHWVEDVHLTFHLSPGATRVVSKIQFRRPSGWWLLPNISVSVQPLGAEKD